MSKVNKKELEYAILIQSAISEVFEEDSDNYICAAELNEGENLTHFFHALANIVPTNIYNRITSNEENQLEFNHTANLLCFQYMKEETK
tara:strand:+ start:19 stop:285 length:267 start_codon:yes stop_codon:yes gene_type:complete